MTNPLYEDRPGNGPGDEEDDEEDEEQPSRIELDGPLSITQRSWGHMMERWAEGMVRQLKLED